MIIMVTAACLVWAGGKAEETGTAKSFVLTYQQGEVAGHPQAVCMDKFAERIEQLSGGQIKVEKFYSFSLFTQEGSTSAVITGDLDISNINMQDTAKYYPAAAMFAAPYIFTGYEHMEKVFALGSPVANDFYKKVADACGFTPLAVVTQGSRTINTTWEKPIMTPADMNGMLLRMPNAPAWIHAGQSLGAKVVPIAYTEVYTALQMGTVNGQDNPLPNTFSMKFYEVARQISLTHHIIDAVMIAINNDIWKQMSPQQQQWMREAAQYGGSEGSKVTYKQEAELIDFFKAQGVKITYPDKEAFQAHSFKYFQDNGLTTQWDLDLYKRVQEMK
jgi:tripartite ATP-independent transporter DctP family solute receptor